MAWRLAESLKVLRDQVNALAPTRSKVSDGTVGDLRHSKSASDHNPNKAGVVTAMDLTHDPPRFDAGAFAETIKANRDFRVKYLIWNKRIWNPVKSDAWRPYYGTNPHNKHAHLSVVNYDSKAPWKLGVPVTTQPVPIPKPVVRTVLKKGMTGGDVPVLQIRLKELGDYKGLVDGNFGSKTDAAVRAIQARTGLKVDGVVGPKTWAKLAVEPPVGLAKGPLAVNVANLFTSARAIAHLHAHEQLRLASYQIGDIWHIGWGRSNTSGKKPPIAGGQTITKDEADRMFREDLADVESAVRRNVTVPLTQGQFDALVSIVYNKGQTWFRNSDIRKSVNEGLWANVARLILKEVPPVGHKFRNGLLRRRQAEVDLLKS